MSHIDRNTLVSRHLIRLTQPDAQLPLTVGNGEFAFSADITSLQTFPDFHLQGMGQVLQMFMGEPTDPDLYSMQLGTLSQWGWHTMPNPDGYTLADTLSNYETARGTVGYHDQFDFRQLLTTEAKTSAGQWLAKNPHRIDLGRIGFDFGDTSEQPVTPHDLTDTVQQLDLWCGLLTSQFVFAGQPVHVETICHPVRDLLAVRVTSPLLRDGRLAVRLAFPYATGDRVLAAEWNAPNHHTTQHATRGTRCDFTRILDDDRYYVAVEWHKVGRLVQTGNHQYRLDAVGHAVLEFCVQFAPTPPTEALPSFTTTRDAAARYWEQFWTSGAAIDLSESHDPRAPELERRIVLSQYLTAINCAGATPPQETGLVCNSWHGKFHLEMHWWHAAHFALWNRPNLLERSLPWYQSILPIAKETARIQGYKGARWPKEVGPDGRDSPNEVGPFLIWQQPHPIYYAELMWRARPKRATLERYREIVVESAEFMADFPAPVGNTFNFDAPLIPAQETYDRRTVKNPTFELVYWYWGLETAQRWLERMGEPRNSQWERVKNGLPKPLTQNGVYTAIATPPYTIRTDHPSTVGAFGMVPPTPLIDPQIMRATLDDIRRDWDWASTWGWDYPLLSMCATRLGRPEDAIDFLMLDTPKNVFLANGHNRQKPTWLPLYLPGNGGLLMAIGMMAGGWDGADHRDAPGFPKDSRWIVRAEGFVPMI